MLAAIYRSTGGSDVLAVEEVPTPSPGPGEVRVRVAVAGVNPTDWKSRAGTTGDVAFDFQVPGQDGAGVIDAVGSGVDEARVGERVWVYFAAWQRQWGTAAQFCVVPSEQAVPLGGASFELGASLGIPALTAYHCLRADGPIDGADVLVAGGAGAVGHAAIELAKWSGARVVATVSGAEKGELARAAGADAVVNYRDEDAADADPHLRTGRCVADRRVGSGAEPRARPGGHRAARGDRHLRRRPGDGRGSGARADDAEPDVALRARVHDPAPGAARGGRRRVPGDRGRRADHLAGASVRARGRGGRA